MSGKSSRGRPPISLMLLAVLLALTLIPLAASAQNDKPGEQVPPDVAAASSAVAQGMSAKALDVAAQRAGVPASSLVVRNFARADYPYSGKYSYDYKIQNPATGESYVVSLNAAQQEVNADDLLAADAAAYSRKYGKIEPALHQILAGAGPDQAVPVIVALVEPEGAVAKRLAPDAQATEAQAAAFQADALGSVEKSVASVVNPFVGRLESMGYKAAPMGLVPFVAAQIKGRDLQAVAAMPEVRSIGPDLQNENQLDYVWNRVRYTTVYQYRRMLGRGTKLAINEVGHGIDPGNPNLLFMTNDATTRCTSASGHETGVMGIIYSSHPTYSGLAMGAQVWEGGSCGGWSSELVSAANRARGWGADAINNSWGSTLAYTTRTLSVSNEGVWDDMVRNTYTFVVFAAGNYGTAAAPKTGWIGNPAGAYNIMSVGSENKTSPATMASYSSWVNPDTAHDDVLKPEVTAPGTNINSTTTARPWVGGIGSGTSFAAPVVTALAGTTGQRIGRWAFDWPEMQKAIMMASAIRNIEGGTVWSDKDGQGGVDFQAADDVSRQYYGGRGTYGYTCATPNLATMTSVSVPAGKRIRFAMAWDTFSGYASYTTQPSADLDLYVYNSAGALVRGSYSWDSTHEIIDWTPTVSGTYTFKIGKVRCNGDPAWLGWAWWRVP